MTTFDANSKRINHLELAKKNPFTQIGRSANCIYYHRNYTYQLRLSILCA